MKRMLIFLSIILLLLCTCAIYSIATVKGGRYAPQPIILDKLAYSDKEIDIDIPSGVYIHRIEEKQYGLMKTVFKAESGGNERYDLNGSAFSRIVSLLKDNIRQLSDNENQRSVCEDNSIITSPEDKIELSVFDSAKMEKDIKNMIDVLCGSGKSVSLSRIKSYDSYAYILDVIRRTEEPAISLFIAETRSYENWDYIGALMKYLKEDVYLSYKENTIPPIAYIYQSTIDKNNNLLVEKYVYFSYWEKDGLGFVMEFVPDWTFAGSGGLDKGNPVAQKECLEKLVKILEQISDRQR